MTNYKRGDVVLVPFPFTDFSTLKQRPAIVVSSDSFNHAREDVIIVAITSQTAAADKGQNYLIIGDEQKSAGLVKDGVVLIGKITTIDQRLIRRTLGTLSPKALKIIIDRIIKIIG